MRPKQTFRPFKGERFYCHKVRMFFIDECLFDYEGSKRCPDCPLDISDPTNSGQSRDILDRIANRSTYDEREDEDLQTEN